MKNKLILLIAAAFSLFANVAKAEPLITIPDAQQRVMRVEQRREQMLNMIAFSLKDFFREATVKGKEQEFLNALGTKAASAMASYSAARAFLVSQDAALGNSVPAPDTSVFKPNQDGSLTFVPPPTPPTPTPPVNVTPQLKAPVPHAAAPKAPAK